MTNKQAVEKLVNAAIELGRFHGQREYCTSHTLEARVKDTKMEVLNRMKKPDLQLVDAQSQSFEFSAPWPWSHLVGKDEGPE